MMTVTTDPRPLVAHVVHRFGMGGLENGVVNLINRLPPERFRHAVVALTDITDFSRRLQRNDVELIALNKPPGHGLWLAPRFKRLMQQLRPTIVHTRNIGALEMALPAAWAGVPVRVHGEHGWDSNDPDGRSRKFQWVRRVYRPFVHRYVALSRHLERYLVQAVGVPAGRVTQLYNGVDTQLFRPGSGGRSPIAGSPFFSPEQWLIGTVGRLQPIKNQVLLARAFVRALKLAPDARQRMRLVIAGEGPLREAIQQVLRSADAEPLAWLAGERHDVPEFTRGLDAFVLPSVAEGISNTILEAMASALPIVATDVGGNGELIEHDVTGKLVPSGDVDRMAHALLDDFMNPVAAVARGRAAQAMAERRFSLDGMVAAYANLYDQALAAADAGGERRHHYV